jgi:hypothetical protein
LLGYIPVMALKVWTKNVCSLQGYQLFHNCMRILLEPLIQAGQVGEEMVWSDREVSRVYPIVAGYVADYLKQCLIAYCRENWCPICKVQPQDCEKNRVSVRVRSKRRTLAALEKNRQEPGTSITFEDAGLHVVDYPFWVELPYCEIFKCFTPDILHQLHKGLFKEHLFSWCTEIVSQEEIDIWFQTLPPHSTLRHFHHGVTHLKQWTGMEAKNVEKVFVGVLHGAVPRRVVKAARAMIKP